MSEYIEVLQKKKSELINLLDLTQKYHDTLRVDESDVIIYTQSVNIRMRAMDRIKALDETLRALALPQEEAGAIQALEGEIRALAGQIVEIDQKTLKRMEALRDKVGIELRKTRDSMKMSDAYFAEDKVYSGSFDFKK